MACSYNMCQYGVPPDAGSCTPYGSFCKLDYECCGGLSCTNNYCQYGTASDGGSCGGSGNYCTATAQCCSGLICSNGSCQGSLKPDAGGQCNLKTGYPACDYCFQSMCAAQCSSCTGDCQSLFNCLMGCGANDANCQNSCVNMYPNGLGALEVLSGCMNNDCPAQCSGGVDAGTYYSSDASAPGQCGLSTGSTTCDTCMDTACLSQCTTCSSGQCYDYLVCFSNCATGDATCEKNCEAQDPTGFAQYNNLINCLGTSCATACQ
jgi:hypothetical protein